MENNVNIEGENQNQGENKDDALKENKENQEPNKSNQESKNSSKVELIRDMLAFKEGDYEIKGENVNNIEMSQSPQEQNDVENPETNLENKIKNSIGGNGENNEGEGNFIES